MFVTERKIANAPARLVEPGASPAEPGASPAEPGATARPSAAGTAGAADALIAVNR
jgi:hypothetical protein